MRTTIQIQTECISIQELLNVGGARAKPAFHMIHSKLIPNLKLQKIVPLNELEGDLLAHFAIKASPLYCCMYTLKRNLLLMIENNSN